jgi:hypothetical protein
LAGGKAPKAADRPLALRKFSAVIRLEGPAFSGAWQPIPTVTACDGFPHWGRLSADADAAQTITERSLVDRTDERLKTSYGSERQDKM